MRCGCPHCGAFMVHEENGSHVGCVCPDCLYRCTACLGTNTVLSLEEVLRLKRGESTPRLRAIEEDLASLDAEDDGGTDGIEPRFEDPERYTD